jgi:hypothetical protein
MSGRRRLGQLLVSLKKPPSGRSAPPKKPSLGVFAARHAARVHEQFAERCQNASAIAAILIGSRSPKNAGTRLLRTAWLDVR